MYKNTSAGVREPTPNVQMRTAQGEAPDEGGASADNIALLPS